MKTGHVRAVGTILAALFFVVAVPVAAFLWVVLCG